MQQPRLSPASSILLLLAALTPSACKVNDGGVSTPSNPGPSTERPDSGTSTRPPPDAGAAAAASDAAPTIVEAGTVSPGDARPDLLADDGGVTATGSRDSGADVAVVEVAAPAPPSRCALPVPEVGAVRRLPSGTGRSDDFSFDNEGSFISFSGRSIGRMNRADGRVEILAADVIGARGGALRALASGDLAVADFERDSVLVLSAGGQTNRLSPSVANPMKMVRGPKGGLYVTGKDGVIFRVEASGGAISTVAATSFEVGGLAFSPDQRVLYVGAISSDSIQAFDVGEDLKLSSPRLVRGQIPRPQALATDECGHLYIVSESDTRVRRIRAGGGNAEVIADLDGAYPWSLAFGSGRQGWSETSLYVHEPGAGRLFEISIGLAGAEPAPAPGPTVQ